MSDKAWKAVVKKSPETRARMSAAQMGNQKALGHRHTPGSRMKMSAALRGRRLSPEHRAKLLGNQYGLGCRHSPEARAKQSEAAKGNRGRLGQKLTPEHKAKLSGPNHHNWLGGISQEPYGWDFNDELREEVRRRDGHKCQLCGVPQAECECALDVHHVDYNKKHSDPLNLVTLCKACHTRTNAHRKYWMAAFEQRRSRGR